MARPLTVKTPGARAVGRTFNVPASEIVVPDVNPSRSRGIEEDSVEDLMRSIARGGQEQPVSVTRVGAELHLVYGFRRLRAIKLLEKETGETWPVRCEVHDYRDKRTALLANIDENWSRKELTPMDRAYMIENMLAEGMTKAEVAKHLGMSRGWVSDTSRLLDLDESTQRLVADGSVPSTTAIEIAKAPGEERKTLVRQALADRKNEVGTREAVKARREQKKREAAAKDEDDGVSTASKRKRRGLKEIHLFFAETVTVDGTVEEPGSLAPLGKLMTRYLDGWYTDAIMVRKLREVVTP